MKKEATRAKQVRNIPLSLARSFRSRGCDARAQFPTPSAPAPPRAYPPSLSLSPHPPALYPVSPAAHVHHRRTGFARAREREREPNEILPSSFLPPLVILPLPSPRPTVVLGQVLGSRHGGRDDSRRVPSAAESRHKTKRAKRAERRAAVSE